MIKVITISIKTHKEIVALRNSAKIINLKIHHLIASKIVAILTNLKAKAILWTVTEVKNSKLYLKMTMRRNPRCPKSGTKKVINRNHSKIACIQATNKESIIHGKMPGQTLFGHF